MTASGRTLLKISNLEKSYNRNRVLTDITFELNSGEIVGIIGENGAGKSTLVKCILNLVKPDSGRVESFGNRISAIHQEFNLAQDLSVAENIFLGSEPSKLGILRRKAMRERALREFARLKVEISPDALVRDLPVSEKQMVEIAKAMAADANIIIMDEPSTLLNHEETERLFGIMRELRAAGKSVIYISHKLAEVNEICDRVVILRDGVLVYDGKSGELDPLEMARRMVGRELTRMFPEKRPLPDMSKSPVLKVDNLGSGKLLKNISFELRGGEVLGLAGLGGSGRSELAETLCGLRRMDTGTVELNGKRVRFRNVRQALDAGLSYLPEDRQNAGILTDFSLAENIVLSSLKRYCRFGWIRWGLVREKAAEYIREFRIKSESQDTLLRYLSGGNQQKAALAKGLDVNPGVFIFDEPTRGVDVAARRDIYEFINHLAESGVACLMICSDLEELLGMCRRVLVMHNGEIAGELCGESLTEEEIMYLATGVKREKE